MSKQKTRSLQFFQFGLRTLLMLMLATGLGMGIYRSYIAAGIKQREAGLELTKKNVALQWEAVKPVWLRNVLATFFDEEVLRQCIAIDAEGCNLRNEDLVHLRPMTEVRHLYLAGNWFDDQGLRSLTPLKKLERLSLWRTKISDEGLRHLAQLHSLQVLDVHSPTYADNRRLHYGTAIPRDSESVLHRPELVSNANPKLTSQCLQHLAGLPNLQTLIFSFPLDDEGLQRISAMPKLRVHSLLLDKVTDAGLTLLPRFPDLEFLIIGNAKIGSGGAEALGELKKLRHLWIEHASIGNGSMAAIGGLSNLQSLSFQGSSITDQDLPTIGTLSGLRQLSLQDTRVTDLGAASLAEIGSLQQLDLRGTRVTANCLEHISALKELQQLYFEAPLDDAGIAWLSELRQLRTFSHGSWNSPQTFYVTDSGLRELAKLRCVNFTKIFEAEMGHEIPGIDVPADPRPISNEAWSDYWREHQCNIVHISGRELTCEPLQHHRRPPQCSWVQIHSARPVEELFNAPLADDIDVVDIQSHTLQFTAQPAGRDYRLEIAFGKNQRLLDILQFVPTAKQLRINPNSNGSRQQADWGNLRFVRKLEIFDAPKDANGFLDVDATTFVRLGELQNLKMIKCGLPENLPPDSLAPLAKLGKLESLELHCPEFTAGHLQDAANTTAFDVRFFGKPRSVNDEQGLVHFAAPNRLRNLWIYGLTNLGMSHIGNIKSLQRLTISDSSLSDDATKYLESLPALNYLDLRGAISPEALLEFKKRHPNIYVR